MIIAIIVAMDRRRVIGRDNGLPWHLPSDLQFFKRVTMGKPIIMGRKTHESIARALPGRSNIIVTRDRAYQAPACLAVHSLAQALEAAGDAEEAVIIGGAMLYTEALPLAQRIYLTLVDAEVAGDTYFPELDMSEWCEIRREAHPADAHNAYSYTNMLLERADS